MHKEQSPVQRLKDFLKRSPESLNWYILLIIIAIMLAIKLAFIFIPKSVVEPGHSVDTSSATETKI